MYITWCNIYAEEWEMKKEDAELGFYFHLCIFVHVCHFEVIVRKYPVQ